EDILGLVLIIEDAAADAQDHRAVPPHQGSEGGLVAVADEAAQQFAVALAVGGSAAEQPAKMADGGDGVAVGHEAWPSRRHALHQGRPSTVPKPREGHTVGDFLKKKAKPASACRFRLLRNKQRSLRRWGRLLLLRFLLGLFFRLVALLGLAGFLLCFPLLGG